MFRQRARRDHPASAKVLLRNGFVEEGCSRCAIMRPDGLHDLRVFARVGVPDDLD
ncbi:RimJ/RimL family protein N-acetyltransferase [Xanthomonas arboricola]|nr:RimJ/RimL family protein N-acetyltransferase [Xanthomonas sp. CFBP 8152]